MYHKLFRPIHSGTQVSFGERLQLLNDHLSAGDVRTVSLAVNTVDEIFARSYFVAFGPAMVGGRVPGQDWTPSGQDELFSCLKQAFRVLEQAANHQDPSIRKHAWEVVANRMTQLAMYELSGEVEALLGNSEPSGEFHPQVVSASEAIISLHDRSLYREAEIPDTEIEVQKRIVDRFSQPMESHAFGMSL